MPAANDRNAFKAGLFICISIVLIAAIVVGIKGVARFVVPAQYRTVRFKLADDIGGLGPGDDVRIGGAKVGVVRGIEIVAGDGKDPTHSYIDIHFTMPSEFALRKDTKVTVQSTLTGLAVLNFISLGHDDELAGETVILGQPSGLSSFLASAGDFGPALSDILHDVKTVTVPRVNGLIQKVDSKIDPIADKGAETLTSINSLLGDPKADIRGTLASVNTIAAKIREKIPALLERAQSVLNQVDVAVGKTNTALTDIQATAASTKDITAAGREIIISNHGKIDSMIASLRTTAENLKGASAEIRRSPWRLLYHPSPGEMANLNLYDSARQFADGANNLSDAATALRDQMKSQPNDKQQIEVMLKKLQDSFDHFSDVEQQLWTRVKE